MFESEPPADPGLDLGALAAEDVDAEAHTRLARGVHRVVRRYCRARLGRSPSDYPLADELAVTITAGILRDRGGELRGPSPVEAIVYLDMEAAVSRILGHGSTRPRRSPHTAAVTGDPGSGEAEGRSGFVLEALDRLPRRPREVLVLRAFVGMTSEQVARALGLDTETVRREQQVALSRLHERV